MKSLLSKSSWTREENDTWTKRNNVTMTEVYIRYTEQPGWVRADPMLLWKSTSAMVARLDHVTKVIFDQGLGGSHLSAFSTTLSCFPRWATDIMKSPGIRKRNETSLKCEENQKHSWDGLRVDWIFQGTANLIIHLRNTSPPGFNFSSLCSPNTLSE